MQNMEFLSRNHANTSTLITVNTGTASYLIDRLSTLFSGSMSTSTAATVTVDFVLGSVETNRIVLENMNFKNFSLKRKNLTCSIVLSSALMLHILRESGFRKL